MSFKLLVFAYIHKNLGLFFFFFKSSFFSPKQQTEEGFSTLNKKTFVLLGKKVGKTLVSYKPCPQQHRMHLSWIKKNALYLSITSVTK